LALLRLPALRRRVDGHLHDGLAPDLEQHHEGEEERDERDAWIFGMKTLRTLLAFQRPQPEDGSPLPARSGIPSLMNTLCAISPMAMWTSAPWRRSEPGNTLMKTRAEREEQYLEDRVERDEAGAVLVVTLRDRRFTYRQGRGSGRDPRPAAPSSYCVAKIRTTRPTVFPT
jgi:hypothetical protein